MAKRKLLAICDTPTVSTGFGVVSKNVLESLSEDWEVHVLGVNYYGDPHPLQSKYQLYSPQLGGDVYGFGRLQEMLGRVQPECIWILNDPWLASEYTLRIRNAGYTGRIVVYTPVDSPNIKPQYIEPLNKASHVVSYTQWGLEEMRKSGLKTSASVIPHGVDTTLFKPVEKVIARKELFRGVTGFDYENAFIVLYVSRNQPRKRVDLFPYILKLWLDKYPHDNVYIHYHGAPKGDMGWDVEYIAHSLGVSDRLIFTSRDLTPQNALPAEKLKYVYGAADVYLHIAACEGWGLTLHEAMACRLPCIAPNYSALSDWPADGTYKVPVDPMPWYNTNNIDTLHKFIDVHAAVEALEEMYSNREMRADYANRAYNRATLPIFQWRNIGKQFRALCQEPKLKEETWSNLRNQLKLT